MRDTWVNTASSGELENLSADDANDADARPSRIFPEAQNDRQSVHREN